MKIAWVIGGKHVTQKWQIQIDFYFSRGYGERVDMGTVPTVNVYSLDVLDILQIVT